jgi:hypothetical protein
MATAAVHQFSQKVLPARNALPLAAKPAQRAWAQVESAADACRDGNPAAIPALIERLNELAVARLILNNQALRVIGDRSLDLSMPVRELIARKMEKPASRPQRTAAIRGFVPVTVRACTTSPCPRACPGHAPGRRKRACRTRALKGQGGPTQLARNVEFHYSLS